MSGWPIESMDFTPFEHLIARVEKSNLEYFQFWNHLSWLHPRDRLYLLAVSERQDGISKSEVS